MDDRWMEERSRAEEEREDKRKGSRSARVSYSRCIIPHGGKGRAGVGVDGARRARGGFTNFRRAENGAGGIIPIRRSSHARAMESR